RQRAQRGDALRIESRINGVRVKCRGIHLAGEGNAPLAILAKAQLAATVCIAAAATVQDVARSGFIEGRLVEECNATATTTATGALGLRGALIVIGIAATATLHVNRRAGHVDRVADEKEGATTATTTAARHAVKDH